MEIDSFYDLIFLITEPYSLAFIDNGRTHFTVGRNSPRIITPSNPGNTPKSNIRNCPPLSFNPLAFQFITLAQS